MWVMIVPDYTGNFNNSTCYMPTKVPYLDSNVRANVRATPFYATQLTPAA